MKANSTVIPGRAHPPQASRIPFLVRQSHSLYATGAFASDAPATGAGFLRFRLRFLLAAAACSFAARLGRAS